MIDRTAYPPIPGVDVLGLVGHAGHGKDELAKMIVRMRPGAERFGFSDALAAHERLTGGMTKRHPPTLQQTGARFPRDQVRAAVYWAIDDKRPPIAIITGVRFHDEADMVRAMGGRLVRVRRVEADGRPYVSPDRDPNHPVEQFIAAIKTDIEVVSRSGDLETLAMMAQHLVAA